MHDPSQDFDEVFFALCKSVNTPHSLACWIAWSNKCFTALDGPVPAKYDSTYRFSHDYLVYSWASKAQVNLENRDLKAVAFAGFIADEEFNRATTARIKQWNIRGASPRVEGLIHNLKRKISSILGPCDIRRILNCCRFGNGATATLSRRNARIDKKITTLPLSVSPGALGYGRAVVEADLHWCSALLGVSLDGPVSLLPCCFEVTNYNVFDTVPKSLKTDRTIAKEPLLNGFLQQGVHVFIRERLRHAGCDLRNQKVNQGWAELAEYFQLATLDLKSASNSVTVALVELLFPPDWFDFLMLLRSRYTRVFNTTPAGDSADCGFTDHKLSMFSSMGNAFTFELESLIFLALLKVTCSADEVVSVYGDDLICPQNRAEEVIFGLETLGFRLNHSKSFTSGTFFESCGVHFFKGCDVTPVYQKKNPLEDDGERVRAHNRLIRWAVRNGAGVGLDPIVRNVCALIRRGAQARGIEGPIGPESDDYFQVPHGGFVIRHGFARVKTIRRAVTKRRTRHAGSYAYWLRLKNEDLSLVTDEHIEDPYDVFDPGQRPLADELQCLQLSEVPSLGDLVVRKSSIPIQGLLVEVDWLY